MVKKQVHILVEEAILKHWDEFRNLMGLSRTSLILNAVRIYELFIQNQLNEDREDAIKEQLNQIEFLIEGLTKRKRMITKESEAIEKEFKIDAMEIKDFEIIASKIMELLNSWGALPETTISSHLNYPTWIIWTVLKKLKTMKKVKVERGEWSLYE